MKILEQAMKWKQMAAPAAEAEATSAKMGNDDELDIDNEVPTILGKRGLEV